MKQEHKIYAGIAVLVVLGIAVYMTRSEEKKDLEEHTVTAAKDLPSVKLSKEEAEAITKFVIDNKDKGQVVLEKKDDAWVLAKPMQAEANQKNVESIVENIQKVELTAKIADSAEVHDKYELGEAKAVHVQAFKGEDKVFDAHFGKSGSRGQMMRLEGQDTVYAAKGYSSFLWAREVKNWRANEILSFEDKNAVSVEVENENGKFSFTKADDEWKAKFYPRKKGKLAAAGKEIDRFDPNKVKDLLRAYKNLKATDFATDDADTGVSEPIESGGGIVRIALKDDAGDYELRVGKKQEGSNRYLVREGGDGTVYVVTSWAADWATAKAEKFQKPEEKKDEEGDDGDEEAEDKDAKKAPKKAPAKPAAKAPPKKAPAPTQPAGDKKE